MAKLRGSLAGMHGGNRALTEAILLDTWIRELTLCGAFPIPIRTVGTEVLQAAKEHGRVLFFWQHLPLCSLPLGPILDAMGEASPVVAHPGHVVGDDRFLIPGRKETAPALSLERPVLTRMRTLLLSGKAVSCLADDFMGGTFSDYALRIAGKTGSRVMLQWAERHPDGSLDVLFRWAPRPECESKEAIAENMEFLRQVRERVLAELGWTSDLPGL